MGRISLILGLPVVMLLLPQLGDKRH